ncbi:MAG: hypothetical protein IPK68_20370 [Bdellovibrionales bacterium]|nr:hypothetical protein [Bdellovibrionales bacterium]
MKKPTNLNGHQQFGNFMKKIILMLGILSSTMSFAYQSDLPTIPPESTVCQFSFDFGRGLMVLCLDKDNNITLDKESVSGLSAEGFELYKGIDVKEMMVVNHMIRFGFTRYTTANLGQSTGYIFIKP